MAYRIVKINNRCKLETQLNYLVCRSDKETRILLDDIDILILENQQICITNALLSELMDHKVRVIVCDSKHNPQGELNPYTSSYNSYAKLKQQMDWKDQRANSVWSMIIRQKLTNQAKVLDFKGCKEAYQKIVEYRSQITEGDTTNREGLAAKLYFESIFGKGFDRREKKDIHNTYLNYGYSLILSAINREVSISGYMNQLGIHHIGETNPFNLGCDLVEPFRPFVDRLVLHDEDINEDNYKKKMMSLLTSPVKCNEKQMLLENAVHDYALSVFSALNGDADLICEVTFLDEQL